VVEFKKPAQLCQELDIFSTYNLSFDLVLRGNDCGVSSFSTEKPVASQPTRILTSPDSWRKKDFTFPAPIANWTTEEVDHE
jgi:hypothetical protein